MTGRCRRFPVRSCLLSVVGLAAGAVALPVGPLAAQESHVVIVSGLGGEERFRTSFLEWGTRLHDAALAAGAPSEHVWLLAEDPEADPSRIRARSTREGIEEAFGAIAERAGPDDRVLLVLIGHGSGSGEESRVSIPGRSLTAADYARLLDGLPTRSVGVVNTASASGDFIPVLAGEGRIVITATRSASQRNATVFPVHFVEAFAGADADLDRDGSVSLLEAFEYARRETDRHFRDRGLIPSENALLAEGASGRGLPNPFQEDGAGALAGVFVLDSRGGASGEGPADPELRARLEELRTERDRLEQDLAGLRENRGELDDESYGERLEALLIELARVGQEIRRLEEGP